MNEHYPFVNTPLPFAFDALEPYIDAHTMELHHDHHLQTYIDNLNAALVPHPRLHSLSLQQLLRRAPEYPPALRTAVEHNAGGVYNHEFFFAGLIPPTAGPPTEGTLTAMQPTGPLAAAVHKTFGDLDHMKALFKAAALAVFGSGYAWLLSDRRGRLGLLTTANQDTPPVGRGAPLLCLDVWEHAYYLKYYNVRAAYVDNWWAVANWMQADARYETAIAGATAKMRRR